jgi:hypothetical protein
MLKSLLLANLLVFGSIFAIDSFSTVELTSQSYEASTDSLEVEMMKQNLRDIKKVESYEKI